MNRVNPKHTCHVDLLAVGRAGRRSYCAVGQVGRRAVDDDGVYFGLKLGQPQHDIVQQHSKCLLQIYRTKEVGQKSKESIQSNREIIWSNKTKNSEG